MPQPARSTLLLLIAAGPLSVFTLPWLIEYFKSLPRLPHFAHAPWALALLVSLVVMRVNRRNLWLPVSHSSLPFLALAITTLAIGLLIASQVASPWLVAFASAGLLSLVLSRLRAENDQSLAYLTPLALSIIRPPLNLDLLIQVRLQEISCVIAAFALDSFGLLTFRSSHALYVPHTTWLVAPECSGIQSVFALGFAALAIGVVNRRSIARLIAMVAFAAVLATLSNALRIGIIVCCGEMWSEGWRHELLGATTLAMSSLLLLTADRLAQCSRRENRRPSVRRQRLPESSASRESSHAGVCHLGSRVLIAVTVGFAWFASAALWLGRSDHENADATPLTRESLIHPEQWFDDVVGWQFVRYAPETRERESDWGRWSEHWHLESTSRETSAIVSVDYPFSSWHEVLNCYEGSGWEVKSREVRVDRASGRKWVEACLERGSERSRLWFALIDDTGKWLTPPPTSSMSQLSWERITQRLSQDSSCSVLQWQLTIPNTTQTTPSLDELWKEVMARAEHNAPESYDRP